jgi:hypothetical protein
MFQPELSKPEIRRCFILVARLNKEMYTCLN